MTIQTSRRKFFGFMGGAAAAAPLAAKDLASVVGDGGVPPSPYGMGMGFAGNASNSPPHDYLRHELADARKHLLNIKRQPDHEARHWHQTDARHIDGLRSVSSVNKARMFREVQEARSHAGEVHWTRRRIGEYCDKLGIPFAEWFA